MSASWFILLQNIDGWITLKMKLMEVLHLRQLNSTHLVLKNLRT